MAISFNPRTADDIYDSVKSNLINRIDKLTNFVPSSFNHVFTDTFAKQQHEAEVAALAVQLSGWADYAGKNITQSDLDNLGVTGITPDEVNKYVHDEQLDQLAKTVGVSRSPGNRATGQIQITTNSAVTIPSGTEFGTQPDNSGNYYSFTTDSRVSTSSATTVTVGITASDVGSKYNVGSGTITYMPDPPTGVNSVTNPSETTGGNDIQTNQSLRNEVKNALQSASEGGTVSGMEKYIMSNTNAISVNIEEKFSGDSQHNFPHGNVVVYGGSDSAVNTAIDNSRPVSVEHFLVRPKLVEININSTVTGTNISTSQANSMINSYFNQLKLNDNVFRDRIIQYIMNSDDNINNISSLDIQINNDVITYHSGTSTYSLNWTATSGGVQSITGTYSGTSGHQFVKGTDYSVSNSTIDWSIGGNNPDDGTDFTVVYSVPDDVTIGSKQVAVRGNINITVS